MKKLSKILFLSFAVSSLAIATANAQIRVNVRPERPRNVHYGHRPPRPSGRHVWVEEGWTTVGGHYQYRNGYWSVQPVSRHKWIAGRWVHYEHGPGYYWI